MTRDLIASEVNDSILLVLNPLNKNELNLNVGTTGYSSNGYSDQITAGNNLSFELERQVKNNIYTLIGIGIRSIYLPAPDIFYSRKTEYGFGRKIDSSVIRPRYALYLCFPFSLQYKLNKITLGMGLTWNFLMRCEAKFITYTSDIFNTSVVTQSKSVLYQPNKTISQQMMLSFSFLYRLNKKIYFTSSIVHAYQPFIQTLSDKKYPIYGLNLGLQYKFNKLK